MYGKWFATVYEGSMVGSGALVFAVWGYCCGKADPVSHIVSLNPTLLGTIIGEKSDDVASAIKKLCAPDPDSRCTDHDGRRLLHCGGFDYFVVTHAQYRAMSSEEQRREYMRGYMRKRRNQDGSVNSEVNESLHTPNPASASVSASDGSDEPLEGVKGKPEDPEFDAFWFAWPKKSRKVNRIGCLKKWRDAKLKSIAPAIMAGLEVWKKSHAWLKDDGEYIPMPSTWLNQRRWEDLEAATSKAPAPRPGSTYTPVTPSPTKVYRD